MKPKRRRKKPPPARSPWPLRLGIALAVVGLVVGGIFNWEKQAAVDAAKLGHDLVFAFKNNFAAGDIGACLALESQLQAELPDGYLFGFQVDRVDPVVFRERIAAKLKRHVDGNERRLVEHLYAGRTTVVEVDALLGALDLAERRQAWQATADHYAYCQQQRSLSVDLPAFERDAVFDLLRERFAGAAVLHDLAKNPQPPGQVGSLTVSFERGELVEYHEEPWLSDRPASIEPAASIWLPRVVRLVIEVSIDRGTISWGDRHTFSGDIAKLPEELWVWEQEKLEESMRRQAIKQLAAASAVTFQLQAPPSDSIR